MHRQQTVSEQPQICRPLLPSPWPAFAGLRLSLDVLLHTCQQHHVLRRKKNLSNNALSSNKYFLQNAQNLKYVMLKPNLPEPHPACHLICSGWDPAHVRCSLSILLDTVHDLDDAQVCAHYDAKHCVILFTVTCLILGHLL